MYKHTLDEKNKLKTDTSLARYFFNEMGKDKIQ